MLLLYLGSFNDAFQLLRLYRMVGSFVNVEWQKTREGNGLGCFKKLIFLAYA